VTRSEHAAKPRSASGAPWGAALFRRVVLLAALLAATPALAAKKALPAGERLDLNRATVSELMRLPGVGQKKAQAIVAHRQKAPFRRPEDVMQVKGCGKGWFAKVRANLVASAAIAPATTARR
jgi:competence protein ComEA